ncbi:hypothetical protein C6N75_22605 [Streptomyces solincola]|uniref:Uncharacterized protein n=1 Tax=Streptomyces solincola TaxID=2100817 RepID=A0A2S9PRH7_9ACTN|nr:hypothetical protein [Streptomyces solincola]PRH77001.1 hypothetical protein C6N75_22605 [Streptomyces solincola]
MDVERVVDELYGLAPARFTAARDAYVVEARRAKDRAAAKTIAALRRPALAAWAANLLARRRPQDARRFLALGESLRSAHRALDAERLREARGRQHQLVTALARDAAALARGEGQPVSGTMLYDIERVLHGVLAFPDVAEQWSLGRLVRVPEAVVGFAAVAPETAPPRRDATRTARPKASAPTGEPKPERWDLAAARSAAQEAEAEADRCEHRLSAARTAEQDATARAEAAAEQVRRLSDRLHQAQGARSEAEAAAEQARRAVKDARDAALGASRRAERAAAAVKRAQRAQRD